MYTSMNRLCPNDIKAEISDVHENILEDLQGKEIKQILPESEISEHKEFAEVMKNGL